jgi:hypothetical protein
MADDVEVCGESRPEALEVLEAPEVATCFDRVDAELNAARARDEDMLVRLETVTREIREQNNLLKSLLVYARRHAERSEAPRSRR